MRFFPGLSRSWTAKPQAKGVRVNERVRTYFELLRFPAVFTAIADVMMGYLVMHGDLRPAPVFLLLAITSGCLYLAGMVLNDVYDVVIDARERPERPIPSGRLNVAAASRLGWFLMGVGYMAAWSVYFVYDRIGPAAVAGMLAVLIYVYDRIANKSAIGPVVMGFCRALNVLLGMSTFAVGVGQPLVTVLTPAQLSILVGMWMYIAAVTWLAKSEVGSPAIRAMIRYLIRGIIVVDAAIVLAFCGPWWAVSVLTLLVPMLLLERWASTT